MIRSRDAAAECVDRRFDRRVAGGDADALDAFVGLHADQDLVGARHDEVADPVRAAGVGRAQDVDFEFSDFHIIENNCLPLNCTVKRHHCVGRNPCRAARQREHYE